MKLEAEILQDVHGARHSHDEPQLLEFSFSKSENSLKFLTWGCSKSLIKKTEAENLQDVPGGCHTYYEPCSLEFLPSKTRNSPNILNRGFFGVPDHGTRG